MSDTDKDAQPQLEEQEQEKPEETEVAEVAEAPPAEEVSTGGRQRRSTQKFGFAEAKEEEEGEFKPPVGPGAKVRDMEAVAERISHMGKKDAETIKSLYNIMYGRRFQQKNIRLIKDHILDFTGIPDADDKTRQQLVGKIGRWMRSYVQDVMDVLGVDRSKKSFDEEGKAHDKEGLISRLIDWLIEPQDAKNAKKPAAKKKTAAAKPKKTAKAKETAGTKRKSTAATKKPAKKAKTSAKKSAPVEEEDEEDATESEVDKEEDEEDANDSDSDFDEEDGKAKKKSKKKTPTKRAPRQTKKAAAASEAESEASDAEEAAPEDKKKTKAQVQIEKELPGFPIFDDKPEETKPLDADVQTKVKEIIAKGDASQLTVKKIVRQLSEDMGQDFTPQKAAIKDFVTNLQM